jgi:signal transduction histidine kinase
MRGQATFFPAEVASDAADLAHHICNLVQVIDGYVELAARRSDDPAVQRYLADARAAADQLVALTRLLPATGVRSRG